MEEPVKYNTLNNSESEPERLAKEYALSTYPKAHTNRAKSVTGERRFTAKAAFLAGYKEACKIKMPDLHPDSVELVYRMAEAVAGKLKKNETKYGWTNEWKIQDWMGECREELMKHISKGDPLDVIILSAFLWHHGESTSPVEKETDQK